MKIEVEIKNLRQYKHLEIDTEAQTATLNGEQIEIDIPLFSARLLAIVSSWEEKMVDYTIMDGVYYSVQIEKDGKTKKYIGQNKFPKNYKLFTNLLQEYKVIY